MNTEILSDLPLAPPPPPFPGGPPISIVTAPQNTVTLNNTSIFVGTGGSAPRIIKIDVSGSTMQRIAYLDYPQTDGLPIAYSSLAPNLDSDGVPLRYILLLFGQFSLTC